MSRTLAALLLLLAGLVLSLPGNAVAGPPEPTNGAMKLDTVENGLRQYQQSKAENKRVEWLKRLAPSHDPRVEETLKAAMSESSHAVAGAAEVLLVEHYGRPGQLRLPPPRRIVTPPPPPPNGPPES
jgi:hypothetical protein